MKFYEIEQAIIDCIDPETGVIDEVKFAELEQVREKKIEGIICYIKQLIAEASALKVEETTLAERRKVKENKIESLKGFVQNVLNGQKFETSKCKVSYRNTKSVSVSYDFIDWAQTHGRDDLLNYKVDVSKTAIKQAILDGADLNDKAHLINKESIILK